MTKSCVICGEEFKAWGKQKTCSKQCANKQNKNQAAIYKSLNLEKILDCKRRCERARVALKRYEINKKKREKRALNRYQANKYAREYYASNLEKIRNQAKSLRARNRNKMNRDQRARRSANIDKYRNQANQSKRNKIKTKTLLMLMSLPLAIKETVNQTTS